MLKDTSGQIITDYATIAQEHKLMICTDRIVPRKTVIYKTLADPTIIKVAGEMIKQQLFTKFRILKLESDPIELLSLKKYYVPYIVVGARYFLDYYRMSSYNVSIDDKVTEVILFGNKLHPEKPQNSNAVLTLEGEERLLVENKAFLMLTKDGQEVNPQTLSSAPIEENPNALIAEYGIEEINSEADVDFVRKRLVNRPEHISRIVTELFEIDERLAVYTPRFRLTYINARTYKQKTVDFDGITSKRILEERLHSRLFQAIKSRLKLARALPKA